MALNAFWKPILPREHGSWGMWIVPYLSTLIYYRSVTPLSVIFFVIFFLGFISRIPAANLFFRSSQLNPVEYRRQVVWLGIYLLGVAGLLAVLWLSDQLITRQRLEAVISWLILASVLFVVQLILENFKLLRSVLGEMIAVLGLSLAVPVAASSMDKVNGSLLMFWLYQIVYFVGPIFYVKMKLAGIKFQKIGTPVDKAKMGTFNLGYYTLVAFALLGASYFHLIRDTVLLAFAPAIVRAFEGTINLVPHTKLKQVGWKEVLYSVWFGIWIAL